MRKLALVVLAFFAAAFFAAAPVSAGGVCPRNTNCAVESRRVVNVASTSSKVTVTICTSEANWRALNAYWKAKGYSGNCFWRPSSKQGDMPARIYARCGKVTLFKGRAYAYNGRISWSYFGPY